MIIPKAAGDRGDFDKFLIFTNRIHNLYTYDKIEEFIEILRSKNH